MKRVQFFLVAIISSFFFSFSLAEDRNLYLYMEDGSVVGFPVKYIDSIYSDTEQHKIVINDTVEYVYPIENIIKASLNKPSDPHFLSFRFNNNYNPQLTMDVDCMPESDSLLWKASVTAIGHYLVPAFRLPEQVGISLDSVVQESKISRVNFKDTVEYSLIDSTITILNRDSSNTYFFDYKKSNSFVVIHFPLDSASVPRLDIQTEDEEPVVIKTDYLNAAFTLHSNGVYADFSDSTFIRGRGNSTWSYDKKPYRLKFFEKGKPFDLKNGKNWVLLANYLDKTLLLNALSMKMGQIMGIPYVNNMMPVELYMNNDYFGNYMFTEKVGISNNSVDIDEESGAYLLEIDTNFDETYKAKSAICQLPMMVVDPDLSERSEDSATLFLDRCLLELNEFENAVMKEGDDALLNYVDPDLLVKWVLVYHLSQNMEPKWPKSLYLYKPDSLGSLFQMGPLWDFDWAYGYESGQDYFATYESDFVVNPNGSRLGRNYQGSGYHFFSKLFQNKTFLSLYKRQCEEFSKNIPELLDFIEAYESYASSSFQHDATIWKNTIDNKAYIEKLKVWLPNRMNYILETIP